MCFIYLSYEFNLRLNSFFFPITNHIQQYWGGIHIQSKAASPNANLSNMGIEFEMQTILVFASVSASMYHLQYKYNKNLYPFPIGLSSVFTTLDNKPKLISKLS